MTKISLVEKMTIYASGKFPHWFNGGEFERLAMDNGYKAANSGRRAREMCEKGILERRIGDHGSVEYRFNPDYQTHSPPQVPKKFWLKVNREIREIHLPPPYKEKQKVLTQKLFN